MKQKKKEVEIKKATTNKSKLDKEFQAYLLTGLPLKDLKEWGK